MPEMDNKTMKGDQADSADGVDGVDGTDGGDGADRQRGRRGQEEGEWQPHDQQIEEKYRQEGVTHQVH